jgi:ABC-type transport system involved in cytochrome c biogenesis ATPase subunit
MLEFTQVQKNYGALRVLDIPHFQLETGLYWLQGPNGSGKTTLLRLIAGILRFKGDLCLQGHSLRKDPVQYRRLVSWGDAEPLYPGFLSGADLLNFYRQILRPEPGQVENLCDTLGIGSWLGTRAAAWSSGMTKKISLLLALLGHLAWLGYAGKVDRFVDRILRSPEYLFLYKLLNLSPRRLYGHFLRVQLWLLLPVWGYALAVNRPADLAGGGKADTGSHTDRGQLVLFIVGLQRGALAVYGRRNGCHGRLS